MLTCSFLSIIVLIFWCFFSIQLFFLLFYFFIYCSTKFNEEKNVGDEQKDLDKNIFHFRMGTDSGIIKKITFSKVDSPFYREAIASQEGKDNVSMIKQIKMYALAFDAKK